jgi:hypothetical protein
MACNGGGGGSSGGGSPVATSSSITAQFIDSPVKGLNVERSISGNAVTGAEGKFTCQAGETVTFKLRDFEIGSSRCGKAIYLDEVAPPTTVDRIAAVLQSLSTCFGPQLTRHLFITNEFLSLLLTDQDLYTYMTTN